MYVIAFDIIKRHTSVNRDHGENWQVISPSCSETTFLFSIFGFSFDVFECLSRTFVYDTILIWSISVFFDTIQYSSIQFDTIFIDYFVFIDIYRLDPIFSDIFVLYAIRHDSFFSSCYEFCNSFVSFDISTRHTSNQSCWIGEILYERSIMIHHSSSSISC